MAKKNIKKNQIDTTRLIFLVGYAVVTLVALVFVVVLCVKPFKMASYDDLKQVDYKDYTEQKAEEYYVFVYSDDSNSNDWYTDVVVQYANKARTLSNYAPIYGYDFDDDVSTQMLQSIENLSDEQLASIISKGIDAPEIKDLLIKYKGIILYLIFGVLTTVINVATYYISYDVCGISNLISTMIAWVVAVAFAFVTNKLIVFESKKWDKDSIKEIVNFIMYYGNFR